MHTAFSPISSTARIYSFRCSETSVFPQTISFATSMQPCVLSIALCASSRRSELLEAINSMFAWFKGSKTRNYQSRYSTMNTPAPVPKPQKKEKPTRIPTPSSITKRVHSPDHTSTSSKIPRLATKSPTPSEPPASVPQSSNNSSVKTISSIRNALPETSPKSPIQKRLDDFVADKMANVDWRTLDEAKEVKRQLRDKAYKQFIEHVLKKSKRKLVVVFKTLSKGHGTYGDGKPKKWIPWNDIKPYITDVVIKITSNLAEWKGEAIIEFMR